VAKERAGEEVTQGLDLIVSPLVQQERLRVTRKAKTKVAEKAM